MDEDPQTVLARAFSVALKGSSAKNSKSIEHDVSAGIDSRCNVKDARPLSALRDEGPSSTRPAWKLDSDTDSDTLIGVFGSASASSRRSAAPNASSTAPSEANKQPSRLRYPWTGSDSDSDADLSLLFHPGRRRDHLAGATAATTVGSDASKEQSGPGGIIDDTRDSACDPVNLDNSTSMKDELVRKRASDEDIGLKGGQGGRRRKRWAKKRRRKAHRLGRGSSSSGDDDRSTCSSNGSDISSNLGSNTNFGRNLGKGPSSPSRGSAVKRRRAESGARAAGGSTLGGDALKQSPRKPGGKRSEANTSVGMQDEAVSKETKRVTHESGNSSCRNGQVDFGDTSDDGDRSGDSADLNKRASRGGRKGANSFKQSGVKKKAQYESEGGNDGEDTEGSSDGEECDLKPALVNPPFEDAEMRPLRLENEAGGEKAEVPAVVNRYLQGFQKEGVEFLWRRIRHAGKPKGAILADDMGVGKTVQIVALLTALLKKTGTIQDLADMKDRAKRKEAVSAAGNPVLIVCPSSVVQSWEDHLRKWGYFESESITESTGRGSGSMETIAERLDAGKLEVVCVGYNLFTINQNTLARYKWLLVVFDEVHALKNPASMRSRAVEKLDGAEVFIGLTGTLIQNDLREFWWVMNMIENGVLKTDTEFKHHFTKPILQGRRSNASKRDVELCESRLGELSVIRDRMVLRRTKAVLGSLLRGKNGTVVFCELTPVQADIYETVLSLPDFKLLAKSTDRCSCGRPDAISGRCCGVWPSDDTAEDAVNPRAVLWRRLHPTLETCGPKPTCPSCLCLPAMTILQKIANHPSLLQVDMSLRDEDKKRNQIAFAQVAFSEHARSIIAHRGQENGRGVSSGDGREGAPGQDGWDRRLARSNNFLQLCRSDLCGKMKTLAVLLKRFQHPPQKVLLFSYSTAMLDILQALMVAEGYTFLRLDGSTPVSDRAALIKRYNKGDAVENFVFLISTKAGGTGLNLQTANKVILYDVNWNPTQDTQAEDRAYRIGQAGKVEVFRLVSTGTIEEVAYMRQIYKLQTSSATMGGKAKGGMRQFEGVQGDPTQKGELWGIKNIMRYSRSSILLELREKHSSEPPIVPAQDGLVMERERDLMAVVTRAAELETATTARRTTSASLNTTRAGNGDDEQEVEFDSDGITMRPENGGDDAGGADGGDADDLGGVVMPHDEMVAADREQELPEASQPSVAVVEIMDEENDVEAAAGLAVSHAGPSRVVIEAGQARPITALSRTIAPAGPLNVVSQDFDDASEAVHDQERTVQIAPGLVSATADRGGNPADTSLGVGDSGNSWVNQANLDADANESRADSNRDDAGGGSDEGEAEGSLDWMSAPTQPPPPVSRSSPPSSETSRHNSGESNPERRASGGSEAPDARVEGVDILNEQPRMVWTEFGAQEQSLGLYLHESLG